ncbi:MAG: hypothetical protein GKS00_16960 [Alphaproteobacteria bacterium]|nr:hypothetical protein [Alphaproteobacteria bacterium]
MKTEMQITDITNRSQHVFSAWVVCGYCILCLTLASFFLSAPARTPPQTEQVQVNELPIPQVPEPVAPAAASPKR